jgi:hypothetical protein
MRAASGPHEVEAFQLYTRRFPGLQHWTRSLAELHDTLESRFYRFQIAHIKVLDEDAFGKEAWLEAAIL